jgi:hypothetical protein
MRYPGSVSVFVDQLPGHEFVVGEEGILRASTSGLTAEEDAATSAAILAKVTRTTFAEVCDNVDTYNGSLPDWYDKEKRGYFKFLFE